MMTGLILVWSLLMVAEQSSGSFSFEFQELVTPTEKIRREKDAYHSLEGLELTRNQADGNISYCSGRASYDSPVQLWNPVTRKLADFTTRFSFFIGKAYNDNNTGDGMAFFLAPFDSSMANNSSGRNLGLVNENVTAANAIATGNASFVAIEFDTFPNPAFDPAFQHVGVDVGSVDSAVLAPWMDGSMTDGRIGSSWVTYDSASHDLTVFVTYGRNPVLNEKHRLVSHRLDLRDHLPERIRVGFTAATGASFETHTIVSWSFNSSLDLVHNAMDLGAPTPSLEETPPTAAMYLGEGNRNSSLAIGLGVGFGGATLCGLGIFLWFACVWKRDGSGEIIRGVEEAEDEFDPAIEGEFQSGVGPKRFVYNELRIATNDFSEEVKLGEGGFGGVYKGSFPGGQLVAVKRISTASKQGFKEYISEVKIVSRLRHRNLVQLIGWCHKQDEFLLVYEYLSNGSLDSHLFLGGKFTTPLPWETRHKIASGLASVLLYLHEGWEQCVVHRDIKSSNIMLDANFNAKLGDFGLARLVNHEYSLYTVAFAGTLGYIAPECHETGKSSKESDVYSFGVVALEICCGRRTVVPNPSEESRVRLVNWVWELRGKGQLLEAVDDRLGSEFEAREIECLMIVGLWCCHPDPGFRPTMKQVMSVLTFESPLPENLPREFPRPMYCASSPFSDSYSSSAHAGSSISSSNLGVKGASKPLLKTDC